MGPPAVEWSSFFWERLFYKERLPFPTPDFQQEIDPHAPEDPDQPRRSPQHHGRESVEPQQQGGADEQGTADDGEYRASVGASDLDTDLGNLPCGVGGLGPAFPQRVIEEIGQRRQRLPPTGHLDAQLPRHGAHAELLLHPALQEGFGGFPEVEIGIELAPQALDVEQGLFQ